jgi:hypothetical protein
MELFNHNSFLYTKKILFQTPTLKAYQNSFPCDRSDLADTSKRYRKYVRICTNQTGKFVKQTLELSYKLKFHMKR